MTADELQRLFNEPLTPQRFDALLARLKNCTPEVAFECLLAVIVTPATYGYDQYASWLLVALDPPCSQTIEQVLETVCRGEIDLSNKLFPFYLAGQFGKANVVRAVQKMAVSGWGATAVSTLSYWLSAPMIELVDPHLHWVRQWRAKSG